MTKGARGSALNILSLVLLGLTALTCLCYTTLFFVPSLAGPFAAPTEVGQGPQPTATQGFFPPTWTPLPTSTPENTLPPPPPTETPTEERETSTPLPTRTRTVTPGPSPTASPTRSKYPFTAQVMYQPSPINPCGASFIAGNIIDLDGKPVTGSGIIVHVEGDADIDTGGLLHPGEQFRGTKVDGRSPFTGLQGLGPSAWSVVLNLSGTSAGTWRVWLVKGGQVSDMVTITLESDCAVSSAIINFQQNH